MADRVSHLRARIQTNAEEIARLHSAIKATLRNRGRSSKDRALWEAACAELHGNYDRLAFPGGYSGVKERIYAGNSESIEAAICFLEVRPYFFRSGYMFKELLRWVKKAHLSPEQQDRFGVVVAAYEEYRQTRTKPWLRTPAGGDGAEG